MKSWSPVSTQAAWMDTEGAWFPVKKEVSTSNPCTTPGIPSWMMHQSCPSREMRLDTVRAPSRYNMLILWICKTPGSHILKTLSRNCTSFGICTGTDGFFNFHTSPLTLLDGHAYLYSIYIAGGFIRTQGFKPATFRSHTASTWDSFSPGLPAIHPFPKLREGRGDKLCRFPLGQRYTLVLWIS